MSTNIAPLGFGRTLEVHKGPIRGISITVLYHTCDHLILSVDADTKRYDCCLDGRSDGKEDIHIINLTANPRTLRFDRRYKKPTQIMLYGLKDSDRWTCCLTPGPIRYGFQVVWFRQPIKPVVTEFYSER